MLRVVVIIGQFVEDVEPVVGFVFEKIFPHHRLQGSVESLDDGRFFVGLGRKIFYFFAFEKSSHSDVVKFFSVVELQDVWVLSESDFEFLEQVQYGLGHVM